MDYMSFEQNDRIESVVMGKAFGEQGTVIQPSVNQAGMPITYYDVLMDTGETLQFSIDQMKKLPPSPEPDHDPDPDPDSDEDPEAPANTDGE